MEWDHLTTLGDSVVKGFAPKSRVCPGFAIVVTHIHAYMHTCIQYIQYIHTYYAYAHTCICTYTCIDIYVLQPQVAAHVGPEQSLRGARTITGGTPLS